MFKLQICLIDQDATLLRSRDIEMGLEEGDSKDKSITLYHYYLASLGISKKRQEPIEILEKLLHCPVPVNVNTL
jgi:hypothetical protein